MTKIALIAWLDTLPTNGEVLIFNPDAHMWLPVSGATYDAIEIKLYDDDECIPEAQERTPHA
ncbi:MAG TPA: hypothetical protein VF077_12330 [Nitrospiraceae bacterium]